MILAMKMLRLDELVLLLGSLLLIGIASVSAREFTNTDGQKMSAEIQSVSGDKVVFQKPSGKTFRYSLKKLSESDQIFINNWAKKNVSFSLRISCQHEMVSREKAKVRGHKTLEKRAYKVTVANDGAVPVRDLVCYYQIFKKLRDRNDAKAGKEIVDKLKGSVKIPVIGARGSTTVKTETMSVGKAKYTTGLVSYDWRESIAGVNLHFYHGNRLVATHYVGGFKQHGTDSPALRDDYSDEDEDEDEDES